MAAQSSVTLNTKVHNPRGTQGGISTWQNVGDTTFGGGTATLTESVRGPDASGNTRVRFLYTVHKLAAADSSCACIGQPLGKPARIEIIADVPSSLTAAERDDLRLRAQGLAAHAIVTAAIKDLEPSWS